MMLSCNMQPMCNKIAGSVWFIISAIGQPLVFFMVLMLPKDIFVYTIPERNIMMLHFPAFITFAIVAKTGWYVFLASLAYLRNQSVNNLVYRLVFPQSTMSKVQQAVLLSIGYSNLFTMAIMKMDTTITGLLFFVIIMFASAITCIAGMVTVYKIVRRQI